MKKIKERVQKMFVKILEPKWEYNKKALYDINFSKLTKNQEKYLKFRQDALLKISNGWAAHSIKKFYGHKKFKQIKRFLLEELTFDDKTHIPIHMWKSIKIKKTIKQNIWWIAAHSKFYGGANAIKN